MFDGLILKKQQQKFLEQFSLFNGLSFKLRIALFDNK